MLGTYYTAIDLVYWHLPSKKKKDQVSLMLKLQDLNPCPAKVLKTE